ncbi:hypothetical protein L596_004693 [Steinernema carpocapsae]|uniref:Uncharacterized protein n=1 Tax=Steinernema carpocapsae TaxID=34508 RepID=A0A4U8UWP9_STECR|nr:hypothetical protein L596_004693 [Steinernema carpocapsae]
MELGSKNTRRTLQVTQLIQERIRVVCVAPLGRFAEKSTTGNYGFESSWHSFNLGHGLCYDVACHVQLKRYSHDGW